MRYSDLFEKQEPGTYVGVRFSDETVEALTKFQADNNVPNPLKAEKFHTTLLYSRVKVDWTARKDLADEECEPIEWHVFDTRDETRCLVLLLDSEYLQGRFDDGIEDGATHDFPDYKPHITLSYDIGDFNIKKLPKPDFEVVLDHEYVEVLKDKWDSE